MQGIPLAEFLKKGRLNREIFNRIPPELQGVSN